MDKSKVRVQSVVNKPNQLVSSQKELDEVFESAEKWLKSGMNNDNNDNESKLDRLYSSINKKSEINDDKRKLVITKVLDYVESIQKESLIISERAAQTDNSDLLSISLHDMKIFNALIHIIIIEGIYPCLSNGVGIPLELRFKSKRGEVKKDGSRDLLEEIMSRLNGIINSRSDVRDIILLGSYSSDLICGSIELAFNPEYNKEKKYQDLFKSIITQIDTYTLFTCYASLLRPGTPLWFKSVISNNLALIPMQRKDGIRNLLEFVGGLREKDEISINDLDKAVKILRSLPRNINMLEYQKVLSEQFITILSNSSMTKSMNNLIVAAVHVIYSLYEQRPVLVSEFEKALKEGLVPNEDSIKERDTDVLTSESKLNSYLVILSHLIKDPSHPSLIINIRSKIIISLWLLLTFLNKSKRPSEVTIELITSLLNITPESSINDIDAIVRSLLINGQGLTKEWTYGGGPNGGIEIKIIQELPKSNEMMELFEQLDGRIELFMKLIEKLDSKIISGLFIKIVKRWLGGKDSNPFNSLIDVKLIEKIVNDKKEHLMKSPTDIIELISSMINEFVVNLETNEREVKPTISNLANITQDMTIDSDDEENGDSDDESEEETQIEVLNLCLSLITGLIMEDINDKDLKLLQLITPQLNWILDNGPSQLHDNVERALGVLKNPLNIFPDESELSNSVDIYNKAITSLNDPIIPIKAHGIYLLRSLIQKKDPIITIENTLKLLISQLSNEDSFIYLNSIKGLEELTDMYGYKSILPIILGYYSDSKVELDERLRTGEVILRVIQRLNELLTSDMVQMIAETLLSIVSTRGKSTDNRLRMSAMSILGTACEINPLGIGKYLLDVVDCAIGILTFETDDEMAIMRRSSVVLIASLLKGFDSLEGIPEKEIATVMNRIRYVKDNDNDPLVRVQAGNVIDILQDKRGF